jgi:UDP-3-O-[3-hydroxymyristoyl] glucosamine N-acyltransferase
MPASLSQLAELVHGRVIGDPSLVVTGAATLRDAQTGQITFIDSADKQPLLATTAAAAAVVPQGIEQESGTPQPSLIQVDDVLAAFTAIYTHLHPPRAVRRVGISPLAVISPSARLARGVDVHPGAIIGDDVEIGEGSTIHSGVCLMAGCKIGREVTIFPNAVLYEETVVGDHVIIHAGAVLGAYGFGYRLVDGRHQLAAQLGNVVIERHVEIGAGTTIDRGTYGPTRIGEGTKIDNQVQIAHNCRIGRHNILCSQVGIAGSCTTGDYVLMGGQVGIRDHVHIGDRAQLGAQSGVARDVPADDKQALTPARPFREGMELERALRKLPEMRADVRELRKAVDHLKSRLDGEQRSAA